MNRPPFRSVVQRRKSGLSPTGIAMIIAVIIAMVIIFLIDSVNAEEITVVPTVDAEVPQPSVPIPGRKPGTFVVIPIDKPPMLKYEPLRGDDGTYFA